MNLDDLLEFFDAPASVNFKLTPLEALAYFKAKGLRTTFDWRDMLGEEHVAAFTVAKMMDQDLLADVHASLATAMADGRSYQAWADELKPMLQAKGWWGREAMIDPLTGQTVVAKLGTAGRLKTIFRTNMQGAYAAGAWEQIQSQKDLAPYLLYDAVDDWRTREEHAQWDNEARRLDDPFWDVWYPPNGYNCRCGVIQLDADDLAQLGIVPESGPTNIPKEKWTNPRTGKVELVPIGQDPGFAYNVGKARLEMLAKLAGEKIVALAQAEMAAQAQQVAAAKGMKEAQDQAKAMLEAESVAAHKLLVKSEGAAQLARAQGKAAQRAAQFQIDKAIVEKTPYLSTALKQLQATGKSFDSPAELLEAAKALAAKTKQKNLLGDWKIAYGKGKAPSAAAQAAFDALPADAQAAMKQVIDAQVAAAAAEAKALQALEAAAAGSTTKAAKDILAKLNADPAFTILPAAGKLAKLQAELAAFQAAKNLARDLSQYKKAVLAGKTPSPGQVKAFDSLSLEEQGKFLAKIDAEKAKLAAAQAPEPLGIVNPASPDGQLLTILDELEAGGHVTHAKALTDVLGNKAWLTKTPAEKLAIVDAWKKTLAKVKATGPEAVVYAKSAADLQNEIDGIIEDLSMLGSLGSADALAYAKAVEGYLKPGGSWSKMDITGKQAVVNASKKLYAEYEAALKGSVPDIDAPPPATPKAAAKGKELEYQAKALLKLHDESGVTIQGFDGFDEDFLETGWQMLSNKERIALLEEIKDSLEAAGVATGDLSSVVAAIKAAENDALAAVKAAQGPKVTPAPTTPAGAAPGVTPINVDKLTQIGPQKGSNPGGLFVDTDTGVQWYVKWMDTESIARTEVLGAKLYELAGVDVPELRFITMNGKPTVASRIIDGLEKTTPTGLSKTAGVLDNFAVDAWLANWDVVGLKFDNLLVKGGKAYRIDAGGSLLYRAQGGAKGSAFGNTVDELESMLKPGTNAEAAKVFKKVTPQQLEAGAAKVIAITDDQIKAMVNAYAAPGDRADLIKRLIARRDDLAKKFPHLGAERAAAAAEAVKFAEETATNALDVLNTDTLLAIKGVAFRSTPGKVLDAKDISRVNDVKVSLAKFLKDQRSLTDKSLQDVETFYQAWIDKLEAAVKPGAGSQGAWTAAKFDGYKAGLKADPTRVKLPPPPPAGMKFAQETATKILKAVSAPVGYAKKNRTGAWKNVPDRHQDAISHYTGNGYSALNRQLRDGSASAGQLAYTALLDEALTIAPKFTGRSTRGVPLSGPEGDKFLQDHLGAWKNGGTVVHRGFFSSTVGDTPAFSGNFWLHVDGKKGVHVNSISRHQGTENEVLLTHESEFRVTNMEKKGDRWHIWMTEI